MQAQGEGNLMPRRPATIERDIPFFFISPRVMRGVRTHGGEPERVTVQETRSHFSTISIRTRPVKREFKGVKKDTPGSPKALTRGDGRECV